MRNGPFPLLCAVCLGLLLSLSPCRADETTLDLESALRFALKHNPSLHISERDVATEKYGIEAAKAERMPKVDFGSGVTRYRYPTPLTPLVLPSPFTLAALQTMVVPDFERTIYDAGASFRLPLYRGGRVMANIRVGEMRKALAQDNYRVSEQDLIYNVTSVYHKILQLQKLLAAHVASVIQLESHYRDVEFFLKAGTAPRLDLLKTEVDLAHAKDNLLLVRNNLDSAFELLKNLMGMEDAGTTIAVVEPKLSAATCPSEEESMDIALAKRPDYRGVAKKKAIAEARIRVAQGQWFPDIYGSGQYIKRAGDATSFHEDWFLGLRLSIPVFDGGLIRSEVEREKTDLEKVRQEERLVRLNISREVRDARLSVVNTSDRIKVAEKAIESARETVRVEHLKFGAGSGTTTDVIDAQTALLRAESDYYQAVYDREIALASLRKAIGEYPPDIERSE
jgi:outer membrane protein